MFRALVFRLLSAALVVCVAPTARAQTPAAEGNRPAALWTTAGAGAGFGIGLWVGLSAFDDAVDSDRKVWTSAAIGAGVGALAGYLISRVRHGGETAAATGRLRINGNQALEPALLDQLTRSVVLRRHALNATSR